MSTMQPIAPIIMEMGNRKKSAVRDLKRGSGRMMDEVEQTLEEVRQGLGDQAEGKEFVPIVMIYRRKSKRRKGLGRLL